MPTLAAPTRSPGPRTPSPLQSQLERDLVPHSRVRSCARPGARHVCHVAGNSTSALHNALAHEFPDRVWSSLPFAAQFLQKSVVQRSSRANIIS